MGSCYICRRGGIMARHLWALLAFCFLSVQKLEIISRLLHLRLHFHAISTHTHTHTHAHLDTHTPTHMCLCWFSINFISVFICLCVYRSVSVAPTRKFTIQILIRSFDFTFSHFLSNAFFVSFADLIFIFLFIFWILLISRAV